MQKDSPHWNTTNLDFIYRPGRAMTDTTNDNWWQTQIQHIQSAKSSNDQQKKGNTLICQTPISYPFSVGRYLILLIEYVESVFVIYVWEVSCCNLVTVGIDQYLSVWCELALWQNGPIEASSQWKHMNVCLVKEKYIKNIPAVTTRFSSCGVYFKYSEGILQLETFICIIIIFLFMKILHCSPVCERIFFWEINYNKF